MLVYRLEDKDGYGPFSYRTDWPKDLDKNDIALHSNYGCTVENYHREDLTERKKWRFGCRNITQLRAYWANELELWEQEGWVVAVYKVRKNYVRLGKADIELAFKADKAVRI